MHVNLLPDSVQWRMRLRASLRQWLIVWAALGCIALAVIAWKYTEVVARRIDLATVEHRSEPLRSIESQAAENAARLSSLELESAGLKHLAQSRQVLGLIGIVARCANPATGKLQVQRMGFKAPPLLSAVAPVPGAGSPPASSKNSGELASLHLDGVASSDQEVAQFVGGLQQSRMFEKVELKSCSEFSDSHGGSRKFQVECRF